jgi:hypothetical protein
MTGSVEVSSLSSNLLKVCWTLIWYMCFHSLLVWSFVWQAAPRSLCQGGLSLSQSTSGTTLIAHGTHIVNCDWFLLKVPEGNGSGFIWDAEGHIVTNYHGEILMFWSVFPALLSNVWLSSLTNWQSLKMQYNSMVLHWFFWCSDWKFISKESISWKVGCPCHPPWCWWVSFTMLLWCLSMWYVWSCSFIVSLTVISFLL